MMDTITLADIRKLGPCYDPERYAPADWQGTVIDILQAEQIPAQDRIWVVVQLIDARTAQLFAVWCAREALKLVDNPDPRSIAACDVAERFANGQAAADELDAARSAALDAARAAAGDAAWAAAWAAARAAARAAAMDAALAAAWAAARAAARDAAWAAAWAAAWDAARDAARAAALDAARDAQIQHLIEMLQE
jgi:hypothetical protein